MPWFRCLIHGYNFSIEVDGAAKFTGFYTTRFVEAENYEQAEIIGLERLKDNDFLNDDSIKNRSPDARVEFEEIVELNGKPPKVGIWPFRRHVAGGFAFYSEDNEEE